jgi:hypothetical protein
MKAVELGARLEDLSDPSAGAQEVDVVRLGVDGVVVEGAEVRLGHQVALDILLPPLGEGEIHSICKVVGRPGPGALELAFVHLPLFERSQIERFLEGDGLWHA